ncbi:MAG: hypothetical protein C4331_13995 [Meiothermus sp.]
MVKLYAVFPDEDTLRAASFKLGLNNDAEVISPPNAVKESQGRDTNAAGIDAETMDNFGEDLTEDQRSRFASALAEGCHILVVYDPEAGLAQKLEAAGASQVVG